MSTKILLNENEIPRKWYNLIPDLNSPIPPTLGPDNKHYSPGNALRLFPLNLIEQELSMKRWIKIPDEVLQMLCRWRPSPLKRAISFEKFLGTPARIYYKDESVSPSGSHKANTAIAQAWYNKKAGTKTLITDTGAGQWGSALSLACSLVGIKCKVYMVRISYKQKPFRKIMMETWGAECFPSPSAKTVVGKKILDNDPDTPGSIGIAKTEAISSILSDESGRSKYAVGSAVNHVLLHQSIIGLEAKKQFEKIGIKKPDVIIGCVGGGSNFCGLAFPFLQDKINGAQIDVIPVEPASCPSMTKGIYSYDFTDSEGKSPIISMFTLGHRFMPPPIHAGGLRYHGISALLSRVIIEGLVTPCSIPQLECFDAAVKWARSEGTIPAPESSHAIAAVVREAMKAKEEGKEKVILFNLSGHGLMDLTSYEKYFHGELENYELTRKEIEKYQADLAKFPKPLNKNNYLFQKFRTQVLFKIYKNVKTFQQSLSKK